MRPDDSCITAAERRKPFQACRRGRPGAYASGPMCSGAPGGSLTSVSATLPRRDLLIDIAIVAVLMLVSMSIVASLVADPARRGVGIALAVAHVAPLVLRRRYPEWVLVAMVAIGLVFVAAGFPAVGLGPAILVAIYTVASRRPSRVSVPLVGGAAVVMAVALAATGVRGDTWAGNVVVFGVVWLLGDGMRRAWQRAAEEEARSAELARNRDEVARRAVAEERVRIARELHDVVAHAMSVIAVQAGTGRMVMEESPDVARQALADIERTSRAALNDMRRLLNVLRSDVEGPQPLGPTPGLGELDSLVAATVQAGLPVELRVEGTRRELTAGVDLAAYRIVQEGLTNARRHSGAGRVSVAVRFLPTSLEIDVVDDGHGGDVVQDGHGTVGMRERARLYGGSVEVGPRDGGGFAVHAWLPYHQETP